MTDRPFGINLFSGSYQSEIAADPAPMLGIEPPVVPQIPPDPFPHQFESVLEARPAVFSFTYGEPAVEEG